MDWGAGDFVRVGKSGNWRVSIWLGGELQRHGRLALEADPLVQAEQGGHAVEEAAGAGGHGALSPGPASGPASDARARRQAWIGRQVVPGQATSSPNSLPEQGQRDPPRLLTAASPPGRRKGRRSATRSIVPPRRRAETRRPRSCRPARSRCRPR